MRIIGYGLLILLLASGCVRRVRHIPVEPVAEHQQKEVATRKLKRGGLYNTTRTEREYKLKPEPYSIGSNETDPELLGPQRTITPTDSPKEVKIPTVEPISTPVVEPAKSINVSMTKDACISMIGQEKFDRYSKRFGGEAGAIKRCAILKKLKRG